MWGLTRRRQTLQICCHVIRTRRRNEGQREFPSFTHPPFHPTCTKLPFLLHLFFSLSTLTPVLFITGFGFGTRSHYSPLYNSLKKLILFLPPPPSTSSLHPWYLIIHACAHSHTHTHARTHFIYLNINFRLSVMFFVEFPVPSPAASLRTAV